MHDTELLRMAAFKLQDTVKRLENLAAESRSPAIRAQLARLARELRQQEATLRELPVKEKAPRLLRDAGAARTRRRAAG